MSSIVNVPGAITFQNYVKNVKSHNLNPKDPTNFSFFTNEVSLRISILQENESRLRELVEDLFDPSKILFVENMTFLPNFRRMALNSKVIFGVDSYIVALEKMGFFLVRRETNFGKEIHINLTLKKSILDDDVAIEAKNAILSFFEYLKEILLYTSSVVTCTADGDGRMRSVSFADQDGDEDDFASIYPDHDDNKYMLKSDYYDKHKENLVLYHESTNKIYTLEDEANLLGLNQRK